MATVDSSTLTEVVPYNAKHQAISDELDDDIAATRAAIQALSRQRNLLSASLLSSTRVHEQLAQMSTTDALPADAQSLIAAAQGHAQENAYRLALGIIAFPFQDPSTEDPNRRLLGVRLDVVKSEGQYEKSYYIFAQRVAGRGDDLRIYRHTIPSFIPLRQYEKMYLPPQDEGYSSGCTSTARQTQDLHGLVKHVRHDLVSWTQRCEAIRSLQKQLQLPTHEFGEVEGGDVVHSDMGHGRFAIKSLTSTSLEATQIRIEWKSGAVGRIKISNNGTIEKAVLYNHHGRIREAEMILAKNNSSVLELINQLPAVFELMQQQAARHNEEDMDQSEEEEHE